jgi:saccharopine dehydrogenase-like NADP-dependent oxidoreductase
MKKVVVFGAGLVSRPLVHYLLKHGFQVTVATRTPSKAEALVRGFENGRAVACNADDNQALREQVRDADLAVSLLPAPRHPVVARACLDFGKHMVTTSYVSPAMREFDAEAKQKDLLLLNEIGVDPGIDHMSAMEVIRGEEKKGGVLTGFVSWCGGLPAPEANDNLFGYKFSWAPRGVLTAAKNSARYLKNGKIVTIPAAKLFAQPERVEIPGVGTFEGYPNRDSVSYIQTYGFSKKVKTVFRGTLRNPGHCKLYTNLIRLGLFDDEPKHDLRGLSYRAFMEKLFGQPLWETIPARLKLPANETPLSAMKSIGLLSANPISMASGSALDVLAERMQESLKFEPGERDMLLMKHIFTFEYPKKKTRAQITALLVDFGIPGGDSSMARTVSLPAAIATRLILEGTFRIRGVVVPVMEEIYRPVLDELATLGIQLTEKKTRL